MKVCFAPGLFQFIRSLLSFFFPKLAVHFTLFPQEVADYFTKLTTTSIEMRKQEKAQAEKRVDYLQLMIELYEKDLMLPESERVIRMQEVVSGVFVLILAGHETSSSTSTNVLHELAYNQEVQDKARREVQKVYKEGGGKVTYEDLAKMTYLEQVISEALRLYPLVNCLFRECTQDYAIPDSPHVIPKGVLVHIPTYALQTDAALWSDPLEFNPDRFAPENESKIVPGSYAPFGDGPRICIGERLGLMQGVFTIRACVRKHIHFLRAQMGQVLLQVLQAAWCRICQTHLYRDLYHRFPASVRYFGILIGTCPTLIIKDPTLVVKVLIKDFSHFYDRGFHVGPNDYLGNNLFFMRNPQWKAARAKMVTVFSTAKMKATFEIVGFIIKLALSLVKCSPHYTTCADIPILISSTVFYPIMELIGLLLLTTLLLVLISIYRWATGSLDYWQKRGIPYVPALPAVGNFFSVLSGRICQAHLYRDLYHSFPASVRYFGILIGTCPTLIIKDPALVVKVLIKDFSHFYDRGFHVGPNDYLGNNLFFMQNPQWKAARTKMVTVFSTAKMKATFEIVDKCSNDFIDYLHTTIPDSKDVPTKVFMGDIFTDLVCKTICGINIHSITSPNKEHVYFMNVRKDSYKANPSYRAVVLKQTGKRFGFLQMKLVLSKVLLNYRVTPCSKSERRYPIKTQTLLAWKAARTKMVTVFSTAKMKATFEIVGVIRMQEVVSGVFVLIVGGHENSTSTSTNVLHELAYNQEVQDKARREVQKVYKEGGGKVTYEDLAKMTYLEQVISEALRLYPLGNGLFRECTQDYAIPDSPHVIQKGVLVHIPTYALQTDATLWSDPLEFNPDRFAPENESKIVPGSYVPFGDGPRTCIGKRFGFLQIKLVLSKVLLNYRVTPCSKSERHYPITKHSFLSAPVGDHWLKFTKLKPEY
ncbi:cytochrome P450 6a2 [Diaphorina citri]|uniref:Cytochrome P450 6a2 n=1 Tax=Diaphorina citri TaxID=121845 RepID=A0A3Q0IZC0_DIACI|nr:cytochrome P450 6a2 [Diaphorina citri]